MSHSKRREKVDVLVHFGREITYTNAFVVRPALASLLASLGTAEDGGNDETTKAKLKGIADQLGVLLTETPTGDPNISGGQVGRPSCHFAKIS